MTPAELPAYLEGIKARVEAAAVPVVDAIAESYQTHLVDVTMLESGAHPPVTQTPAPAGRPPAIMTGRLRASVYRTPGAGGGGVAEAMVSPNTIYASTQEWGGVHTGKPWMWLWVRYIGPYAVRRHGWVKHTVDIPGRPYMAIAVAESITDGQLTRAGAETFMAVVWGA